MALKAGRVGVDPSQVDENGFLIGTNRSATTNSTEEEEETNGTQSGQGGTSPITS